jgi:hypothetical protein
MYFSCSTRATWDNENDYNLDVNGCQEAWTYFRRWLKKVLRALGESGTLDSGFHRLPAVFLYLKAQFGMRVQDIYVAGTLGDTTRAPPRAAL